MYYISGLLWTVFDLFSYCSCIHRNIVTTLKLTFNLSSGGRKNRLFEKSPKSICFVELQPVLRIRSIFFRIRIRGSGF